MTTTSIDEGKLEPFMGQAVTDMAHQRSPARQRDALARGLVDGARREPRPHWHLVRLVGGRNERRHRPDRRQLPDRDLQERVDRARRDRRQHAFAPGAGPLRPGSCRAHEPRSCSGTICASHVG